MDANAYQEKAATFRVPTSTPEERVFGLLEEAGEVAGVFKRLFRGDYQVDVAGTKLAQELGDVLWYVANIAYDNNWKLADLMQANLDKLESRKLRNVLTGSGDER
ncbi:MAG: nucleoside triphosphate pyrophosphohydrolase family protein [Thermoplasmatales archaeon]